MVEKQENERPLEMLSNPTAIHLANPSFTAKDAERMMRLLGRWDKQESSNGRDKRTSGRVKENS